MDYKNLVDSLIDKNKSNNYKDYKNNDKVKVKYNIINYKIHKSSKNNKDLSRNQVPKNNKYISYDSWEHIYFNNIVDISNIIKDGLKELDINIEDNNIEDNNIEDNNCHFIDTICNFIYYCSSGEVSNTYEFKNNYLYNEFVIKRHNLYNKNGTKDSE